MSAKSDVVVAWTDEEIEAIQPKVTLTAYRRYLAVSPTGCPIRTAVVADTEAQAIGNYRALLRQIREILRRAPGKEAT